MFVDTSSEYLGHFHIPRSSGQGQGHWSRKREVRAVVRFRLNGDVVAILKQWNTLLTAGCVCLCQVVGSCVRALSFNERFYRREVNRMVT